MEADCNLCYLVSQLEAARQT